MHVAQLQWRSRYMALTLLVAAVIAARTDDEADVNTRLDPDLAFLEEDPAAPDIEEGGEDDDEDDELDEEHEDFEEDEDADLDEAEESLEDDEDFDDEDEDLD